MKQSMSKSTGLAHIFGSGKRKVEQETKEKNVLFGIHRLNPRSEELVGLKEKAIKKNQKKACTEKPKENHQRK